MIDLWFVQQAQTLSLLSDKYKDRVLGKDPRIILPFYDEDGELIGVSGRAINDSPLRYMTMRFRDDVPLIFNLNKVDKTKTIYVTEGPIDSLFLPNSIAVAGSDFKKIQDVIIYEWLLLMPSALELQKLILDNHLGKYIVDLKSHLKYLSTQK